jgi:hypothetical protein
MAHPIKHKYNESSKEFVKAVEDIRRIINKKKLPSKKDLETLQQHIKRASEHCNMKSLWKGVLDSVSE